MTFDEVVNVVCVRLGNRVDLREMVETEMEYCKVFMIEQNPQFCPWYLLPSAEQDLTITGATSATALPSDFIREYEFGTLWGTDDDGNTFKVIRKDYEWLKERYKDDSSGADIPLYYAVVGTTLQWFPRPINTTATVKIMYYRASSTLVKSPSTNPHLTYAADLLIALTGRQCASNIMNDKLVQRFTQDASIAMNRLMAMNDEMMLANQDIRRGEAP